MQNGQNNRPPSTAMKNDSENYNLSLSYALGAYLFMQWKQCKGLSYNYTNIPPAAPSRGRGIPCFRSFLRK